MIRSAISLLALSFAAPLLPADVVTSSFDETYPAGLLEAVAVDNVHGEIRITTGSSGIRVRAAIEADGGRYGSARETLERWPLVVKRSERVLELIVDSPHRCEDGSWNCERHWDEDRHGRVRYDFTIEVPARLAIEASTIDGPIDVRGSVSSIRLRNVNDDVSFRGDARGGTASTVNGDITAHFASAPVIESKYTTVNGEVDLRFPETLDATFAIGTMNGEILTDFDWEIVPVATPARSRREGTRWVLRHAGKMGVRIGSGRTAIVINTLNGDILIRKDNDS